MTYVATRAMVRRTFVLLFALSIAGCASTGGLTNEQDAIRSSLDGLIVEARENGASEESMAVLVTARDEATPVTSEQVRQSRVLAIECLEDVGFRVFANDDPNAPGGLNFGYGLDGEWEEFPPELELAGNACYEQHTMWVEIAHQQTNRSLEVPLEERFEPYRASFLKCLTERDLEPDESASAAELLEFAGREERERGFDSPCTAEVGFDIAN